jgi:hypothetical protein
MAGGVCILNQSWFGGLIPSLKSYIRWLCSFMIILLVIMYTYHSERSSKQHHICTIIVHMYFSILLIHWQQHATSQSIIPSSSHHHKARYHFLLHACSRVQNPRSRSAPMTNHLRITMTMGVSFCFYRTQRDRATPSNGIPKFQQGVLPRNPHVSTQVVDKTCCRPWQSRHPTCFSPVFDYHLLLVLALATYIFAIILQF